MRFYKYTELINANTQYSNRMKMLSNRIFGEVVRPTNEKSMRVVKMFSEEPLYKKENVINYYPRHVETGLLIMNLRRYGLFRDEHQDFIDEMKRLKALRGKVFVKGEKKRKAKSIL
ncbi:28S ribosomal protein S33, mitochondrial [Adelges cooleyi]|uniref:28S ribosomal protein S33, mitochondrial n=1 Tax=Adelges cooleyi TaxID=133065 RepID=UPI00217F42E8|nr:28S ribosomal protein S33, mitochondrial [Adelges cooleyi]XP_050421462.1 28S ribosomal protein S33, mitochondrial [Adelges cooleyi]XP_050421463.1 28S ribosomal protein S33, mitochondrial [Adelges cooleyi]XP_050421464.1 28S ribosomal protein S33, mitochondrial [Adelges cooleyi]